MDETSETGGKICVCGLGFSTEIWWKCYLLSKAFHITLFKNITGIPHTSSLFYFSLLYLSPNILVLYLVILFTTHLHHSDVRALRPGICVYLLLCLQHWEDNLYIVGTWSISARGLNEWIFEWVNDRVQMPQVIVPGSFSFELFSLSCSSAQGGGWVLPPVLAAKQGKGVWQPLVWVQTLL